MATLNPTAIPRRTNLDEGSMSSPPAPPRGPQMYRGNGKHEWQRVIDGTPGQWITWRLRVPGGFLYRYGDVSPVFVPMPEVVGYVV